MKLSATTKTRNQGPVAVVIEAWETTNKKKVATVAAVAVVVEMTMTAMIVREVKRLMVMMAAVN